jgi:hypothetical protein
MAENPNPSFPANWLVNNDFDPNQRLVQFRGRDYLNVQNRLLWFIRDQRALIAAGLAKVSYTIHTDLVELDHQRCWAHFKTFIRDVLGNEVTMYGSESAKDFPDYIEKASTKSLGRALLLLGYGTAFAFEIDEGDRIVDAPQEHPKIEPSAARTAPPVRPQPTPVHSQATSASRASSRTGAEGATIQPPTHSETMATDRQLSSIRKLYSALNRPEPDLTQLTFNAARETLTQLSQAYAESRQAS